MYWPDINDKKHGKRKMYYTEISWNRKWYTEIKYQKHKNIQVDSYEILKKE